jgi:hypothetical protein
MLIRGGVCPRRRFFVTPYKKEASELLKLYENKGDLEGITRE